jgi:hypothetical protein
VDNASDSLRVVAVLLERSRVREIEERGEELPGHRLKVSVSASRAGVEVSSAYFAVFGQIRPAELPELFHLVNVVKFRELVVKNPNIEAVKPLLELRM